MKCSVSLHMKTLKLMKYPTEMKRAMHIRNGRLHFMLLRATLHFEQSEILHVTE
jgi:hypothetical protein